MKSYFTLQVLVFSLVCAGFTTIYITQPVLPVVLFYYLGGAGGITLSGHAYAVYGWNGVAGLAVTMLLIPFTTGVAEIVAEKKRRAARNNGYEP